MTCRSDINTENRSRTECLITLKTYKNLSQTAENHEALLQEKTPLLYPATLLEEKDATVVSLSLDILENFISNESTHSTILSTFGIYEALQSLSLKRRNKDYQLSNRAEELVDILRSTAPPAFGTRSRSNKTQNQKRNTVYLLQIQELNNTNKKRLDRMLVKTSGVISFLIDLERKRCTIRLCQNTSIQSLAVKILEICKMTPMIVTKDLISGEEVLKDLIEGTTDKTVLEYYTDEGTPPKNTALTRTIDFVKNGNCLFKSVTDFWNESFYW
ncbi:armadillo repeat-containing protein 1-like [Coccinella septempunctata]|uniref:armadillo repeat-containing protein 1-like n=1 Tax=Coccinella septempunctata TaxID=41139 RepID=UPI001D05CF17|nr:armadillo repeat-containing protein 1-like [Coccinella septempunctata]